MLNGKRVRIPGTNSSLATRCRSIASPRALGARGSDTSDSWVTTVKMTSHPMGTNIQVRTRGTKKRADRACITVPSTASTTS